MVIRPRRVVPLALLAILVAGTGAAAADVTITSDPGDRYTAPAYSVGTGENALFDNPSGESHNVTAKTRGPDGKPLFRSRTISSGTTPVDGVQYLIARVYDFYCTVHAGMEAKLDVSAGSGSPAARPDIEVTLPAQSLASVRRSGKLRVRVRALTESENVSILARKGARRIGSKGNVDLRAGASRTLAVTLSRSGRKALGGLEKATVSARGSVPFGSPDLAARRLR